MSHLPKHETEEVYDEQMGPLVVNLIKIAQTNGLPLLISVGFIDDLGGVACCTTKISAPFFGPLDDVNKSFGECVAALGALDE